jgi:hypothetical protein
VGSKLIESTPNSRFNQIDLEIIISDGAEKNKCIRSSTILVNYTLLEENNELEVYTL